MADYHQNTPSYKSIKFNEDLNSYEAYFEELKSKSHELSCCYGRMACNFPNHTDVALWKEKSKKWYEYNSTLRYMKPPIETSFKVFEEIGSFEAEFILFTELEIELINKFKKGG